MPDNGRHDPPETDPAALSSSEDLDEDQLGVDPLEAGVEPPERWSAADRRGMTGTEQREGETVEERVRQERPDFGDGDSAVTEAEAEAGTDADTEADTDTADSAPPLADNEIPLEDAADKRHRYETDQSADEAGGSVAESIRTPDEPE